MATHSSILAWRIPWTELATVHGVARVGHDLATEPPPPSLHGCLSKAKATWDVSARLALASWHVTLDRPL